MVRSLPGTTRVVFFFPDGCWRCTAAFHWPTCTSSSPRERLERSRAVSPISSDSCTSRAPGRNFQTDLARKPFGYEISRRFCALSARLGRPVTHMVRGHDHVDERYEIPPAYARTPVLTTVALSRRLGRELFGPFVRVPTLARWVRGSLPQVYRLHIPEEYVRHCYAEEAGEPPILVRDLTSFGVVIRCNTLDEAKRVIDRLHAWPSR